VNLERGRVGQFVLFFGLLFLALFFTTDQAKHPTYGLFFMGALGVLVGGFMIWRSIKPPERVERFRGIRNMQARQREQKAKREAAKAAKKAKKDKR